MAKGKIPGLRKVSKKEARELSKLPWVADESLTTLSMHHQVRVLPDGRVLLYDRELGNGTLYPSRAAAGEMDRQCAEILREGERKTAERRATGIVDPCLKLLPPIDDFLRDVDAHADSLGKAIKIKGEALDRSVASLDIVDGALKRIPRTRRPVPEILTPLVAYVGEVMRRASGGCWSKYPMTQERKVPVYDTDELALWMLVKGGGLAMGGRILDEKRSGSSASAAVETARKAMEVVQQKEGGDPTAAPTPAMLEAGRKAIGAIDVSKPKPFRLDTIEEPIRGHENEPIVTAGNGQMLQPFALVYIPMFEPSRRIPLRAAVETILSVNGYRPAPNAFSPLARDRSTSRA